MEYNRIEKIYKKLYDDESRQIFDLRFQYMMDNDKEAFALKMLQLYPNMKFKEIEQFINNNALQRIVIYGNGQMEQQMYAILKEAGFNVSLERFDQNVILLSSVGYIVFDAEIFEALKKIGCFNENLLYSKRMFTGRVGWQYFDMVMPQEKETFLDVGGYSGETSIDFLKWCQNNYQDIFILEPNPTMYQRCQETIAQRGIRNVTILDYAAFNKSGNQLFLTNDHFRYTAKLSEQGNCSVKTITLDELIGDRYVSFIKLDVEGVEKEVIQGAMHLIKKHHPKLAISAYHHPGDFISLANQILEMDENYSLALRHYHTDTNETVLYAFYNK